MRVRLSVIADTHTGSTTGLAPDEPIPHPEGMTINPTPSSRWLWGFYREHLQREAEESRDHDVHVAIFNGDIMDGGMHHGQIQLYHPEEAVEKWISERVVSEAVDVLAPDYILIVLGTPSHTGMMGGKEESLGAKLNALYPGKLIHPEGRYGWHVWRGEFDGCLVDVRHHGKLGMLPHTLESYQKRYAFDVWSSQAMYTGQRAANLAIRSHRHKYADSGPVPVHKNGTRLISTPCYQLGTEYVVRKAIETPADIGMVGITIQDGRVRDVFEQVVTPQPAGGEIWRP